MSRINVRVSNQLWRPGVPAGGTAGQYIQKSSSTDYDTEWVSGVTAAPHTIASHSDTTATGAELETLTDGSDADSLHTHDTSYVSGGTDVAIADGGTGASTAQAAIDSLTAVAGATNEHVLTKDTATGNAIFKAAAGGGGGGLWTEVAQTTISGSPSSVTFESLDSYDEYWFAIREFEFSADDYLVVRVKTSGSYLTSGYYSKLSANGGAGSTLTNGIHCWFQGVTAGNNPSRSDVYCGNLHSTAHYKLFSTCTYYDNNDGAYPSFATGSGYYGGATAAVTGIEFSSIGAATFESGTITLFGRNI